MSVGQKVTSKLVAESQKKKKKSFLQEMKDEMKKVSWTSKDELKICTKIVLSATFIFGLGIYVIDLTLKGLVDLLRFSVHWLS